MNTIDLRLTDSMQVIQLIPKHAQEMADEFDYPNFPYIHYDINFDEFIGKRVHWHWHDTIHYILVQTGHIILRTAAGVHRLKPGDLAFVNVNALHCLEVDEDDVPENCNIRSYVFQPSLVSGTWENDMSTKYIQPILNNTDIQAVIFDDESARKIMKHLIASEEYMHDRPFGYEFKIRHELTEAWLHFLQYIPGRLQHNNKVDDRLHDRMRSMLQFIRMNYQQKIDLDEIADSAMISQRECFRVFKKTLGVTPNHYLQNFRVRMAARMLVETDASVAEVAQSCGFSDTSYFGKTFQKYMNCSPTEYRKKHMGTFQQDTDD